MPSHRDYMLAALDEADEAYEKGEVPVGAVLVVNDEIVARAHNLRDTTGDPTAHAELLAVRYAGLAAGDWRLGGATLYVTLEPCAMCASAIVLARVSTVVFGASDPHAGAAGSAYNILEDGRLGHRCEVIGGVLEDRCAALLDRFFSAQY